jgi:hypothetical protein
MGGAPRRLEKEAIATPIAAALGGTTVCPSACSAISQQATIDEIERRVACRATGETTEWHRPGVG